MTRADRGRRRPAPRRCVRRNLARPGGGNCRSGTGLGKGGTRESRGRAAPGRRPRPKPPAGPACPPRRRPPPPPHPPPRPPPPPAPPLPTPPPPARPPHPPAPCTCHLVDPRPPPALT